MKILVTGGAGFIASHIVDAYIRDGHEVVVVDNLSSGSKRNINSKATFYKADITNRAAMERIMKRERPEVVNHHAALISVTDSANNALPTYQVNVVGSINVLEAFARYGNPKHFLFPSSAAVYGNPKQLPVPETHPLNAISPYGVSKVLAEHMIKYYAELHGFTYAIFRYSNVYGPRQSKISGGVIAKVQSAYEAHKQPLMFGKGDNVRDYVYVGDVAEANVRALSAKKNMTVNISCSTPTKDKELFAAIQHISGSPLKPIMKPARPVEIKKSILSNAAAKKLLGWKPSVVLEEGLRKTLGAI
jgi:UDP-glucose 4-epimerase